ncbi:maleylpyruvate isomerase family mycothiol-dependent enzyme [Kitasatospora sp. RB6PN24]|uniref:maleylpyruvate isomerase family mycothiol-dependent enzyme n=1 Tax=Kitasatospora humi TaxID=2893891 RepID=UPI001E5B5700|nr:maleylpyruvate isomerase family mycothiol-dependent enzyme [Kitasatospora humi]MCC9310679.1 maleylpyruvate isomerase family mycothiol-dependent enzyme [Kitasatospora humi]
MDASSEDLWPMIHAERRALLEDVRQLAPAQWTVFSLCAGRTVRDVLAHMAATARMTQADFVRKAVKARFNFQRMTDRDIHEFTRGRPSATVKVFELLVDSQTHPRGPDEAWLGETVVHAEDIRRPLGIAHEYPMAALTACADFYRRSNFLIGGKKRVAGLKLTATDTDWSVGEGPEVSGPMLDLLLVITGRPAGLAALSGDGVELLSERMPSQDVAGSRSHRRGTSKGIQV